MRAVEEEKEQSTTPDNRVHKAKVSVSIPIEIIEEILSRLPVKTLLRFKSVCKPWLSLISDPSFIKLQFNRNKHRTALFITANDSSSHKRLILSAPSNGGRMAHLMTQYVTGFDFRHEYTKAEHLNGLILFSFVHYRYYHGDKYAYIINPSTPQIYKLTLPMQIDYKVCAFYFFGFDESKNEHKVLNVRFDDGKLSSKPATAKFMIFSLSDYKWRSVHMGELPIDIDWNIWYQGTKSSVCVNSVIHLNLHRQNEILAFDLKTEKFSIINLPPKLARIVRKPDLIKINGLLGVFRHCRKGGIKELHLWILQDYEKRVWVKETLDFSDSWIKFNRPFPLDSINMDQIVFSPQKSFTDVMNVLIYNMKTRCFTRKSVKFNLGHGFLRSNTLEFNQVRSYVESLIPLREE